MIYTPKITSDIQINSLRDLVKLKPFLEDSTLKINKSQIARELGKDRRTVDKYLKGYEKPAARRRSSCIDDYYDISKIFFPMKTSRLSIINVFYGNS